MIQHQIWSFFSSNKNNTGFIFTLLVMIVKLITVTESSDNKTIFNLSEAQSNKTRNIINIIHLNNRHNYLERYANNVKISDDYAANNETLNPNNHEVRSIINDEIINFRDIAKTFNRTEISQHKHNSDIKRFDITNIEFLSEENDNNYTKNTNFKRFNQYGNAFNYNDYNLTGVPHYYDILKLKKDNRNVIIEINNLNNQNNSSTNLKEVEYKTVPNKDNNIMNLSILDLFNETNNYAEQNNHNKSFLRTLRTINNSEEMNDKKQIRRVVLRNRERPRPENRHRHSKRVNLNNNYRPVDYLLPPWNHNFINYSRNVKKIPVRDEKNNELQYKHFVNNFNENNKCGINENCYRSHQEDKTTESSTNYYNFNIVHDNNNNESNYQTSETFKNYYTPNKSGKLIIPEVNSPPSNILHPPIIRFTSADHIFYVTPKKYDSTTEIAKNLTEKLFKFVSGGNNNRNVNLFLNYNQNDQPNIDTLSNLPTSLNETAVNNYHEASKPIDKYTKSYTPSILSDTGTPLALTTATSGNYNPHTATSTIHKNIAEYAKTEELFDTKYKNINNYQTESYSANNEYPGNAVRAFELKKLSLYFNENDYRNITNRNKDKYYLPKTDHYTVSPTILSLPNNVTESGIYDDNNKYSSMYNGNKPIGFIGNTGLPTVANEIIHSPTMVVSQPTTLSTTTLWNSYNNSYNNNYDVYNYNSLFINKNNGKINNLNNNNINGQTWNQNQNIDKNTYFLNDKNDNADTRFIPIKLLSPDVEKAGMKVQKLNGVMKFDNDIITLNKTHNYQDSYNNYHENKNFEMINTENINNNRSSNSDISKKSNGFNLTAEETAHFRFRPISSTDYITLKHGTVEVHVNPGVYRKDYQYRDTTQPANFHLNQPYVQQQTNHNPNEYYHGVQKVNINPSSDSFIDTGWKTAKAAALAAPSSIPGIPGEDYPTLSRPPLTSRHACRNDGRRYVADVSSGCQVFIMCVGDGPGEPMLCPNGTLFSQEYLVCDWWYNVDCH